VRGRFSQHVHTWTGYAILGLKAVVPLYLFAHVGLNYFYQYSPAYGISMLPTIHSFGEWVLISKYYRRGRGVVVGDLVSFKHPVKEGEQAIKRVVGLSGDFVLMNTPEKSSAMIQVRANSKIHAQEHSSMLM
jgi:inner membrane protease subunit 1